MTSTKSYRTPYRGPSEERHALRRGQRIEHVLRGLRGGSAASPDAWPASEAYRRLSPDGADHWPILLGRLQRMWAVEPSYTRDEIRSIRVPTLIIVGDADLITPEHAVEMFRTIPRAQLCV